jgi:hypothetical protein
MLITVLGVLGMLLYIKSVGDPLRKGLLTGQQKFQDNECGVGDRAVCFRISKGLMVL